MFCFQIYSISYLLCFCSAFYMNMRKYCFTRVFWRYFVSWFYSQIIIIKKKLLQVLTTDLQDTSVPKSCLSLDFFLPAPMYSVVLNIILVTFLQMRNFPLCAGLMYMFLQYLLSRSAPSRHLWRKRAAVPLTTKVTAGRY